LFQISEGFVLDVFAQSIKNILSRHLNIDEDRLFPMLEIPPDSSMGDYGFPCFTLAKTFRKAPKLIAEELVEKIRTNGEVPNKFIRDVSALNGYVNFFIDKRELAATTLSRILQQVDKYGSSTEGSGKTVVLDFSSPNIAKRFSIAHIRSTVIGNSLYKIFSFLGYACVRINHLGDWGTQFGKLISAYKRWGDTVDFSTDPIMKLQELYVRFNTEAEFDATMDEDARAWFKRLEDGDAEALRLWQLFKDISLEEFDRVYKLMGIEFDSYAGESFYNDKIDATLERLKKAGLVRESQGALIVDLEPYEMPPCLLQKSDGATLYATRDISAALYRYETYKFDKLIYVVGTPQSLHFKQVFKVLELLSCDWVDKCVHVPFGVMLFEDETMSTRKGNVVFLEDVLQRAIDLTREIIEQKNPGLENKDEVARDVGIGAVVFADLSNNRIKDVNFDWNEILNFDGETGPYLQYTHVRTCSVLRKSKTEDLSSFVPENLLDEYSVAILKELYRFPEIVSLAAKMYEPSLIARHLLSIAARFNRFYHEYRILDENKDVMVSRLALVNGVRQVLANGLGLLGIKVPQEM
jgi:arginyl-tRNA synthetase